MSLLAILAVLLVAVWGLLNIVAAVGQLREREIPIWSAVVLLLAGLALLASAWMLYTASAQSMTVLVISLVAVHVVTIYNGYHLFGRFKASYHLGRLMVSMLLIVLAYFTL